jgi:hypothetical protein
VKTWMPGTRPGMMEKKAADANPSSPPLASGGKARPSPRAARDHPD